MDEKEIKERKQKYDYLLITCSGTKGYLPDGHAYQPVAYPGRNEDIINEWLPLDQLKKKFGEDKNYLITATSGICPQCVKDHQKPEKD